MSTFVQEEVTTWVQACTEEAALRAAGASAEELEAARLRVLIGLVSLVTPSTDPDSFVALFNLMLQDTSVPTTPVTTDDPIVTAVAEPAEATEEVENAD